ncbi:MAG: hypothetical protein IH623_00155 [Verrucomicrobia bacterium]|nr:hypothetical protein [Verrucomicrobiota bacterium]
MNRLPVKKQFAAKLNSWNQSPVAPIVHRAPAHWQAPEQFALGEDFARLLWLNFGRGSDWGRLLRWNRGGIGFAFL